MKNVMFIPSPTMVFSTVPEDFKRLVAYAKNKKNAELHIDLKDLQHCDSAGLALLIAAKRMAQQENKQCLIRNASSRIKALAEFCGVAQLLEF